MGYAGECTAEKEERGRKRESGGRKERAGPERRKRRLRRESEFVTYIKLP